MNPNLCSNSLYPSLTLPSLPSVPLLSVPLPFALRPTSGTHRYVLILLVHGQDQKSRTATRYHSETGGVFLLFPPCTLSLNTSHLPAISSPAPYWPLLPVIHSDLFLFCCYTFKNNLCLLAKVTSWGGCDHPKQGLNPQQKLMGNMTITQGSFWGESRSYSNFDKTAANTNWRGSVCVSFCNIFFLRKQRVRETGNTATDTILVMWGSLSEWQKYLTNTITAIPKS